MKSQQDTGMVGLFFFNGRNQGHVERDLGGGFYLLHLHSFTDGYVSGECVIGHMNEMQAAEWTFYIDDEDWRRHVDKKLERQMRQEEQLSRAQEQFRMAEKKAEQAS